MDFDKGQAAVHFWESATKYQKIAWVCFFISKIFFILTPITIHGIKELGPYCLGMYGVFICLAIVFALKGSNA